MCNEASLHHHKDATPDATVARIVECFAHVGIRLRELAWYQGVGQTCSVIVAPEDLADGAPLIHAHGKGMSQELARASAYAEFAERAQCSTRQTPALFGSFGLMPCALDDPPDAVSRTVTDLRASRSDAALALLRRHNIGEAQRLVCFPYYNVMTGDLEELPASLLYRLCTANGMAAGNTPAEALGQAICEILERYVTWRVFFDQLRLPTIPLDTLSELPIFDHINQLRAAGLQVIVKDASLGGLFPVVAVVVHEPRRGRYSLKFGSDPVLDVAIQRCLTEGFQGSSFDEFVETMLPVEETDGPTEEEPTTTLRRFYATGQARFVPSIFLAGGAPCHVRAFIGRSHGNDGLLQRLVETVAGQGHTILARDTSYLGFPSYSVYIPGMSEIFDTPGGAPLEADETPALRRFLLGLADRSADEIGRWLTANHAALTGLKRGKIQLPELFSIIIDERCGLRRFFIRDLLLADLAGRAGDYALAHEHMERVRRGQQLGDQNADYVNCMATYIKHRSRGLAHDDLAATLEDLYGAELAAEVMWEVPSPAQPIRTCILPRCGSCSECGLDGHCHYPSWSEIVGRLNRAMAEHPIDQSRLSAVLPRPGLAPR
jgi:ribosomal protein S12 methylthiotransferase accessory factor